MPENATSIQSVSTNTADNRHCKLCECLNGKLECYAKFCQHSKFPSYARLQTRLNEKKRINARTIPFFADILKSLRKDSLVFVTAGPIHSQLSMSGKSSANMFTVGDIAMSKLYYQLSSLDEGTTETLNDFVVLTFVSAESREVHSVLLMIEIRTGEPVAAADSKVPSVKQHRNLRNNFHPNTLDNYLRAPHDLKVNQQPRKTIIVHPGEAIQLTGGELTPKNLSASVEVNNLVYFLVSGNLKYGELKLKKHTLSDEQKKQLGWNKVNDIYLEKKVTEFTQRDLDLGDVWYEPMSEISAASSSSPSGCPNEDCDSALSLASFSAATAKYDHCMFEVCDKGV